MSDATASTFAFSEARDALTDALRQSARTLLAQAVEAEVVD